MATTPNRLFSILISLALVVLLVHSVAYALIVVTESSTVTITAQVSGGGATGGGGGGAGSGSVATTVSFSGLAYPSSKIVILQDGVQVMTTTADQNARFSANITNIPQGSYNFSIYTEDQNGLHSVSFSFPVYVTSGAIINIGDIILAPTIDVDKAEVKRGDIENIFGFATPNSQVNITVHSTGEHLVTTTAGPTGVYLYKFDTTPLEYGTHNAQSRAILATMTSTETDPVSFIVSNNSEAPQQNGCGTLVGDLNCDGKVNLIDFSIMAYWYKKGTTPPMRVDLNGDGKINLIDFSILAYHWTG